ncbi:unnamed protein product, partial [Rotaria sp. Silwood1]
SMTFILMKIICDLNLNTNTEAREQQRRFVNERFQRSNENIDHSIEQSKNHVQNVRERLHECKNLLLLKR